MMWPFGSGKRNLGKLLATGQLTSYGSGTGVDDGALKKGIVKRYTVLTTGQYSGNTNITINSKTDAHSNNCVFDDHTGLMWSRYAAASVGPSSNGTLPWTTNGNGEGIFPYVAAANANALGGHSDWKIPNALELVSIIDYEAPTGAPDSVAFPSYPLGTATWSSTTVVNATANSVSATFSGGNLSNNVKTTNYYVLLVRG
jgi:hypothetical protein